jgi:AmmeMemoRadiSam system protein B/AmmeMemoRadiSam system protein A
MKPETTVSRTLVRGAILAAALAATACRAPTAGVAADGAPPRAASGATRAAAEATPARARVVRPAAVAGSWYEGEPAALGRQVDGFFARAAAAKEPGRKVLALVSPHAGYRFSGQAAAAGYKLVSGRRYERVVVLGPSHHVRFSGVAVTTATHYETPLGAIPVDRAACDRLLAAGAPFHAVPAAERREHSVEMQLPMLQRALGAFKLVPLVVGELDDEGTRRAGAAIRSLLGDDTLVVASSDFTHRGDNYGYEPFADLRGKPEVLREKLRALDMGAVDAIRKLDRPAFTGYLERTGATVCGARPIAIVLEALAPRKTVATEVLSYYTSGDVLGSWDSSVSYVDLVFYGDGAYAPPAAPPAAAPPAAAPPAAAPAAAEPASGHDLSAAEKRLLLTLARRALEAAVRQGEATAKVAEGLTLTPRLKQTGGAFVTLKIHGELRGCIGTLAAHRPLWEDVIANAENAALHDPRFNRVRADELPTIDVEVSVLTPPREVPRATDIVVGKHGIILEKSGRRATFLPQVAPEQGWDRETTLGHLARKAGLAPDAWRAGARFWVYEAIVFGEK